MSIEFPAVGTTHKVTVIGIRAGSAIVQFDCDYEGILPYSKALEIPLENDEITVEVESIEPGRSGGQRIVVREVYS